MELIRRWKEELAEEPRDVQKREVYRRCEAEMDKGLGSQVLSDPRAARIVQESLFFGHGRDLSLHAWSIMPNHVHALFTPLPGKLLKDIMRDMKGYTSRAINRLLGLRGQLWEEDYFDRWIRDDDHFSRVAAYIEWNPVKAKLCPDPKHWPWSSANEGAWARLSTDVTSAGRDADEGVRAPRTV
jgi:REP element-mobilizing transposase RayT